MPENLAFAWKVTIKCDFAMCNAFPHFTEPERHRIGLFDVTRTFFCVAAHLIVSPFYKGILTAKNNLSCCKAAQNQKLVIPQTKIFK